MGLSRVGTVLQTTSAEHRHTWPLRLAAMLVKQRRLTNLLRASLDHKDKVLVLLSKVCASLGATEVGEECEQARSALRERCAAPCSGRGAGMDRIVPTMPLEGAFLGMIWK